MGLIAINRLLWTYKVYSNTLLYDSLSFLLIEEVRLLCKVRELIVIGERLFNSVNADYLTKAGLYIHMYPMSIFLLPLTFRRNSQYDLTESVHREI